MKSSGIYCDVSGSAPCIYGSPPGESDNSGHRSTSTTFGCRYLLVPCSLGLRCFIEYCTTKAPILIVDSADVIRRKLHLQGCAANTARRNLGYQASTYRAYRSKFPMSVKLWLIRPHVVRSRAFQIWNLLEGTDSNQPHLTLLTLDTVTICVVRYPFPVEPTPSPTPQPTPQPTPAPVETPSPSPPPTPSPTPAPTGDPEFGGYLSPRQARPVGKSLADL